MKGLDGYIYIETHADQPGQIRVLTQDAEPTQSQPDDPVQIRYIAHFKNAHIAYMHVHNSLKKKLVNINTRFYTAGIAQAIAAVECEDLPHERVWIDPSLPEDEVNQIAEHTLALKRSHKRVDRAYLVAGGIGLLFLLIVLIGGI